MSGRLSKIRHFFMNRHLAGLEKFLFLCLLLTCAALVAQNRFIKTRLVIEPGGEYRAFLGDDRHNQGNSSAEWIDKSVYEWRCTLREKFEYPYCYMQVQLDGVDFTRYETMTIALEYEGQTRDSDSVRVTLLNDSPLYQRKGGVDLMKYNVVEIPSRMLTQPVTVSTEDFDVPDWWSSQFNVAPKDTHTEIDNVMFVEVATGSGTGPGEYRFKLHSLVWEGNLISREQWYFGIIVAWLVVLFGVLVVRLWNMKSALNEHFAREQSLKELNKTLDIKSRHYEKMARSDPLTGVYNRAGVGDFLMREVPRHLHSGDPLTVILMDLDHFKRINDTYGHHHGDEVLTAVARLLRDNLRTTDCVARWGGEEFLLVCPNTPLENGRALAEKLRRSVAALDTGLDATITASFGVAAMGRESIEALMKRADGALYAAKQNGRDRVEVSEL